MGNPTVSEILTGVLNAAQPRPDSSAPAPVKNQYAVRFANAMACALANSLRSEFPGILPDLTGTGTESPAQSGWGTKKLDVNYSTPELGLGLGVSLKSVHFRDRAGAQRYTHNMKRNDEELRTEAMAYHQRQPYAVLVAVLYLPYDSCEDAKTGSSSFGSWVKHLRILAGREAPYEEIWRFERVFICLYDPQGSNMEFFDVANAPPKAGPPLKLFGYDDFLTQVVATFERRNVLDFTWAPEPED